MPNKKWEYDPGERRTKHKWNRPEAGFDERGGVPVGKCPSSLDWREAESLLNNGIPWPEEWEETADYPSRIYNVHKGVVYEARPTMQGFSYHGFPAHGRLPRRLATELAQRAAKEGYERELRQWLKTYCLG
jgi:hypothetical protein